MDIIINAEDQSWRSDQNITPTDNEFKDQEDHTFMVDWIRVYKHENDLILTSLETTTTLQIFPNTSNGNVIIKSY